MIYDVAIIGGGVVGGLLARELSRYRITLCILEKEEDVAMGTSKANSAIVHAGFDAVPGTLKAKLNVKGAFLMPKITKELGVPYQNNGSMVLAFTEEDLGHIRMLYQRGLDNGVPDMKLLSPEEVWELEPNVSREIKGALLASSAGIVCPYELTIGAIGNAMDNGVELMRSFKVASIQETEEGFLLTSEDSQEVSARYVVNAAGIYSDEVAAFMGGCGVTITPRKGEYMLLDKTQGRTVSHTIFQPPSAMGKGVLVTPTVDGNLLLGPTAVDQKDKEDTSTTAEGLNSLSEAAKRSVPDLNLRAVITSFAGLRATPDNHDFTIAPSEKNGRFINAVGIESPGLSAAPAIAEYIRDLLKEAGLALEEKEDFHPIRPPYAKFRERTEEERKALIQKDPRYGRIVCRCETVTEGEIIEALTRNPKAVDMDGIKRRTRAGMGRCQAGFCTPITVELLAQELGIPTEQVTKFGKGSEMLMGKTK